MAGNGFRVLLATSTVILLSVSAAAQEEGFGPGASNPLGGIDLSGGGAPGNGTDTFDDLVNNLGAVPFNPVENEPQDPVIEDPPLPPADEPKGEDTEKNEDDGIPIFSQPTPGGSVVVPVPNGPCTVADCSDIDLSGSPDGMNGSGAVPNAEVPLPATFYLLASGLIGGLIFKKNSANKK